MIRSTLGTWEEISNCGSIIALLGKGYKLVRVVSWVNLLNKLTLSVYYQALHPTDGHSAMLVTEVG